MTKLFETCIMGANDDLDMVKQLISTGFCIHIIKGQKFPKTNHSDTHIHTQTSLRFSTCQTTKNYSTKSLRVTQLCQTLKTRQKLDWKIREIDGSYLCLQGFDKFWMWSARNDRKQKLFEYAETFMKQFVKSHQVKLFWVGFSYLKPMWVRCYRPAPRYVRNYVRIES